jgi:hypothetical protein
MQLPTFQIARRNGAPQFVDLYTLTPETLVVHARWGDWGYAWVWPIGVRATRAGSSQRLPIVDVTRWAQLGIGLAVVVFSAGFWIRSRRRRAPQERREQ